MPLEKPAVTRFPVHDLIRLRWSPRAFADRTVEPAVLGSLLEAARWAPSCFNEQPWSFLLATREDPESFARMVGCLNEGNRTWAASAPVLMLSVARLAFAEDGSLNRHAFHDVGLAVGQLALQAVALGLAVHQMAGFSLERARETCRIPEGCDPVAAIALGYPGEPEQLPVRLRERETATRVRKPLETFVFSHSWGSVWPRLQDA